MEHFYKPNALCAFAAKGTKWNIRAKMKKGFSRILRTDLNKNIRVENLYRVGLRSISFL